MAYDGITVAAVVAELKEKLLGGRFYKIAQPERDALLITVKTASSQCRLFLSADASLPLVYLTEENKPSPMTAPSFCMAMRKHLQNARIVDVTQPGLERIIRIDLEHLNEMGDLCRKTLVVEIMGKHSNIILIDEQDTIVDSIKHVSALLSSVREVLPGRTYEIAKTQEKADPLQATEADFLKAAEGKGMNAEKAIMSCYMGISPQAASEIVRLSGIRDEADVAAVLKDAGERKRLWESFSAITEKVRQKDFSPCIYSENGAVTEFSAIDTGMYPEKRRFDSISKTLEVFYSEKEKQVRIRQRSVDLRRIVQTATERNARKLELQEKQLKDTEKREKNRLYGELLSAYAYQIPAGAKTYAAENYYDENKIVNIPLDETMTAQENAKRYFDKYQKQKRTYEAMTTQVEATTAELEHLESVQVALDIARSEDDLTEIRQELADCGYIKKHAGAKRAKSKGKPLHYVTEEGFHIYVGKNNYQNDLLTFQTANGGDWWFHAKKLPGSHVIVKTEGKELPDRVYEQAAALAAYYSKASQQEKAEVDYLQRKNVKKPAGSAPGFVVYYTNYSMAVKPGIVGLKEE